MTNRRLMTKGFLSNLFTCEWLIQGPTCPYMESCVSEFFQTNRRFRTERILNKHVWSKHGSIFLGFSLISRQFQIRNSDSSNVPPWVAVQCYVQNLPAKGRSRKRYAQIDGERKRRTYRTFSLNVHFKRSRGPFNLIAAINSFRTRLQISSTYYSFRRIVNTESMERYRKSSQRARSCS